MNKEKVYSAFSGYVALLIVILLIVPSVLGIIMAKMIWLIAFIVIGVFMLPGFVIVNPNESSVLILFGAYKGTIRNNGFWWVNPFFVKKKMAIEVRKCNSRLKIW